MRKNGQSCQVLGIPPSRPPQKSPPILPMAQDHMLGQARAISPCTSNATAMPHYILTFFKFQLSTCSLIFPAVFASLPMFQAVPMSFLHPSPRPFLTISFLCLPPLMPESVLPRLLISFSLAPASCLFL